MPDSRKVAVISCIVAVGATARIVLGELALVSPTALFGVMIKVGLTETLTIASGLAIGPVTGFVTGAMIIVVSDLFILPGAWTPFIASIIGLLGLTAGFGRRLFRIKTPLAFALLAVLLTLLSEFLQNVWVSVFYGVPISVTVLAGLPSLFTALANNLILLSTVGARVVALIQQAAGGLDTARDS